MRNKIFISLFVCLLISFMFVIAPLSEAAVGTWEYNFADVKGNQWEKDWKVVHGAFEVRDESLAQTDRSGDDNNAFRAIAQTKWEIEDGTIEARVMHDVGAA